MERTGPPDDFHEQATHHADYGMADQPTSGEAPPYPPDETGQPDAFDALESEPTPWYRKPPLLIAWLVFVVILIGLIAYGITELLKGGQGTSPTPSTSSTSSTTTTTTTTPTSTTTPTTSSAGEAPAQQPTQQPTREPGQQAPTHRHHLPQVPSVITIPGVPTVITVPPGLR
ncbi:hypothetical protein [Mycobacterium sp. E3247]|uniref:hypothetical protein n=1 Tax=Mycobacterium sp. E3247 TaxID=1856864 RepID=UPI0007FDD765|nr:hypothetical protein [Mycobacterium sp. E3247]OBH07720.1 hypothetical protein A9X04_24150 [Mycobacterium sp. E3247]